MESAKSQLLKNLLFPDKSAPINNDSLELMDKDVLEDKIKEYKTDHYKLCSVKQEIENSIYNMDNMIQKYERELYMRCDHIFIIDSSYGPYDYERVCNKCGLYRDYELEQRKYNLKLKIEKE